jgi:hypothetical protein
MTLPSPLLSPDAIAGFYNSPVYRIPAADNRQSATVGNKKPLLLIVSQVEFSAEEQAQLDRLVQFFQKQSIAPELLPSSSPVRLPGLLQSKQFRSILVVGFQPEQLQLHVAWEADRGFRFSETNLLFTGSLKELIEQPQRKAALSRQMLKLCEISA